MTFELPDVNAPLPNPMQWEPNMAPIEWNGGGGQWDYYAVMTAVTAVDDSGGPVEYYFECTTEPWTGVYISPGVGGFSSGWITVPTWTVPVGQSGQDIRFIVRARDQYGNETEPSEPPWAIWWPIGP